MRESSRDHEWERVKARMKAQGKGTATGKGAGGGAGAKPRSPWDHVRKVEPVIEGERWVVSPSSPAFEVSSEGRVRRRDREQGSLHKKHVHGGLDQGGRPRVGLSVNGQVRLVHISTLVAEAFIGERPRAAFVIYLDNDRANVRASNLAYGWRGMRLVVVEGGKKMIRGEDGGLTPLEEPGEEAEPQP